MPGQSGILLLRHGHRISTTPFPRAETPISERGVAESRELGLKLKSLGASLHIVTSPVLRCQQTAYIITEFATACHARMSRVLGDPGALIEDESLVAQQLHNPSLFSDYFEGKSILGMRNHKAAFQLIMDDLVPPKDSLTLAISHDWIVATVAKQLGLRFSPHHIPDFLEGVWIPQTSGDHSAIPDSPPASLRHN